MTILTAKQGDLYLNGQLLIVRYDGGDCDTIAWPLREQDRENLVSALYDAREMMDGFNNNEVQLPDGEIFRID